MEDAFGSQIKSTDRCREIIRDEIETGYLPKRYMFLTRSVASIVFRARAQVFDPAPRKPHWDNIWRCSLCLKKDQSYKHYEMGCEGTRDIFGSEKDRDVTWSLIQNLRGSNAEIKN